MPLRSPPTIWKITSEAGPLYGTRPSMPSGTSLDGETSPSWKYRSAEPSSMAPRLPIPRITLKRRPSSRNDSPGLSSVPASIEPIITLSAPAASAFTTSTEYLMPPSAITGMSPCAAHQLRVGMRLAQAGDGLEHALGVAVRRIHDDHVAPRVDERPRASQGIGGSAHRGGDTQPAVLILVGVGVPPALEDVFDGDETLEDTVLVHHRKLLDAVLAEDPLRFVQGGAHRRGHQAVFRHRVADRAVELALELQVAVGDDTHQAPCVVHDRHPRDVEPLHQSYRLAQRPVRPEGDRVQDHPRLAALHLVHFGRLAVDRHVLVDHADAALTGDRDRHLRFGDRVHRGGHEGDVEGNAAGEARAHVHIPRVHAREPRNE